MHYLPPYSTIDLYDRTNSVFDYETYDIENKWTHAWKVTFPPNVDTYIDIIHSLTNSQDNSLRIYISKEIKGSIVYTLPVRFQTWNAKRVSNKIIIIGPGAIEPETQNFIRLDYGDYWINIENLENRKNQYSISVNNMSNNLEYESPNDCDPDNILGQLFNINGAC